MIIGLFATPENVAEIVDSSPSSRPVADARRFVLRLPHLTDGGDVAQLQQAWPVRPAATLDHPKDGRASRPSQRGTGQQSQRCKGHSFIQPHEPKEWVHLTLHCCHGDRDDAPSWTSPTRDDAPRERSQWLLAAWPEICARLIWPQQFFKAVATDLSSPTVTSAAAARGRRHPSARWRGRLAQDRATRRKKHNSPFVRCLAKYGLDGCACRIQLIHGVEFVAEPRTVTRIAQRTDEEASDKNWVLHCGK